ncbi:hypothetical protein N9I77_00225 [Cyclobacteriaceae bacterium]|nr:hypothetical protein [Cyclobacteriaceae bacterium]HAQ69595.1 hypothetical protein [Flavobacteriales bacterium]
MRFWLFFLSFGFCLFESCNEVEDCTLDPYGNYAVATFDMLSGESKIIAFDSIILEGFGRLPGDRDTLIGMLLPLPVENTEAVFNYYTDSSLYSLAIGYKSQPLIYDLYCEATIRFYDLDTSYQSFDSLVIVGSEVHLDYVPINFEIYL